MPAPASFKLIIDELLPVHYQLIESASADYTSGLL
jgi:hypothetical protein